MKMEPLSSLHTADNRSSSDYSDDPAVRIPELPSVDFAANRHRVSHRQPPMGPLAAKSSSCTAPSNLVFQYLTPDTNCSDSTGRIFDFQGPYTVVEDDMMLGKATRYLQLDPHLVFANDGAGDSPAAERWDASLHRGCDDYRRKIHCLLYPNCNHHVAHCLSRMHYAGWAHYEMFQLWFMIFFRSRFCGTRGFLISMGPFIVFIVSLVVALVVTRS